MDDIVKLPYREFFVTLVCASNRRKEQNIAKQSIGFNWGAAAVSTAVWRGVSLSYVLKMVGLSLDVDYGEERHVCFVVAGCLPNDYYAKDVLLAYQMNGEILSPDHGYPLRVIIPDVIGGRMVKWLNRITIINKESNNYYHYNDNRVLPPNVDAERATKEGWWYKPDYIINELNINSAIVSPVMTKRYQSQVSKAIPKHPELNHPAVVNRRQRPLRNYCWIFWSFSVPVHKLIESKKSFKIYIIVKGRDVALKFEHPTQAGPNPGGWMVKTSESQQQSSPSPSSSIKEIKDTDDNTNNKKLIKASEVEKHTEEDDCWIIVENKVYDCTKYLNDHPGGLDSILINAGSDCTEEFILTKLKI
ncbi:10827_t:CDS:2 [Entrophospora sp. SA101]|nr:10827_t:CDS:2 [Entrophospora sp. SA101]